MPSHAPEPWRTSMELQTKRLFLVDGKGNEVQMSDEDVRRVAACINACRGLPTEWLEGLPQHYLMELQYAKQGFVVGRISIP